MNSVIILPVIGYEDKYKISSTGTLIRLSKKEVNGYKKETEMRLNLNSDGYFQTNLVKDKKLKTVLIHRLVAIAFIPNHENKPLVNHINGVKTDNCIENLEWCTHSENLSHALRTGLKTQEGGKNPNSRKVINKVTGEVYECINDARILTKYSYSYFYRMLSGKFKNNTEFEFYNLNSNQ